MKSALLTDLGSFKIITEPDLQPTDDEILVKVTACGICGSDVHYYKDGRIGNQLCKFPQRLGHEAAGLVVAAPDNSRFAKGDRVAIEPARPCFNCEHCSTGYYNRCPSVQFLGSPAMHGAFSELLVLHPSQLEHIPESMSFTEAALLEPLGVAYHALTLSKIKAGQSVAIFGAGPIGLLTLAMAKACGAGETFICDKLAYRLDFAKKTYAPDHCIDSSRESSTHYIQNATHGRGVDISFEAVGAQQTFDMTLQAARIGGKALFIGIPEVDTICFDPHLVRRGELLIQNVRRSNLALAPCINMVKRGDISVEALATHHFTLDSIADAFSVLAGYRDGVIKAIVTM